MPPLLRIKKASLDWQFSFIRSGGIDCVKALKTLEFQGFSANLWYRIQNQRWNPWTEIDLDAICTVNAVQIIFTENGITLGEVQEMERV